MNDSVKPTNGTVYNFQECSTLQKTLNQQNIVELMINNVCVSKVNNNK